jgi:hypothetical protein
MRASNYWIEETAEIEVFGESVGVDVYLTESGTLDAELEHPVEVSERPEFGSHDFEGTNEEGIPVTLEDTFIPKTSTEVGPGVTHTIDSISPQRVVIGDTTTEPYVGDEITLEFDMLCFEQNNPMIDSFEDIPLLEREDWVAYATSYEDAGERIEYIKEYRTPVRTGRIEFQQFVNGPPKVQFQCAEERLLRMVELISFLQGVGPAPVRAQLTEVNGEPVDGCVWLLSGYRTDMGHMFKGERILWHNDLREFLDESYDEYVNTLREKYALNVAVSWYLDSLNSTRTIDSRFSSLVNGIEVMAKRYSEHGPRHSGTKDKIRYLVNELEVDTTDLARYSPTFNDDKIGEEDGYQEYFYNRSRQHVVHGEHFQSIDSQDLFMDYEATLVLLRRLLRNQLIDVDDMSNYSSICDLNVGEQPTVFF